ncbi:hypothetical protein G0U57_021637, partial [Chelydra serpentina]
EKERERKYAMGEKERERKHAMEEKERERKHAEEEKDRERKHALEMEKTRAEQNLPDNTNNPSPTTHKWERLCPPYDESRDIAEYFLTFERLCNLHTIPDDHKMTILVAKLTGSALD